MLKLKAHIQFKYINDKDNIEKLNLKFEKPIYYMVANTIEEVEKLINKAEYYQSSGYYVVLSLPYESAPAFDKALQVYNDQENYGSLQVYKSPVNQFENESAYETSLKNINWHLVDSEETIQSNIHFIHNEIIKGNTYQVNYTTRLIGNHIKKPYHYFKLLTYESNGDYQAYIENDNESIISVSPELFFQTGPYRNKNNCIVTKPMKGTIARGQNNEEDKINFDVLNQSNKDKAENVMIVDLLRNDLSKISKTGTVKTTDLFMIEKYKTVYQMTSTIYSEISSNQSLYHILQALFPCGSITGAPKESTMKIIHELETLPRGVYCGTIGLMLPDGRNIFNVPIRTIQNKKDKSIYGVGAGITIDSNPHAEIKEFKMKTKILDNPNVHLIETIRIENGKVSRRKEHTRRIEKSAAELNIPFNRNQWDDVLDTAIENHSNGTYKLRIELDRLGDFQVEINELSNTNKPFTAQLMLAKEVPTLYTINKTTARKHFEHSHETNVVLYYNEENQITEFDIGNVVIFEDGDYFTPPFSNQILNGCMRQSLLRDEIIKERIINKDMLLDGIKNRKIKLFMINSLREWIEIDLKF